MEEGIPAAPILEIGEPAPGRGIGSRSARWTRIARFSPAPSQALAWGGIATTRPMMAGGTRHSSAKRPISAVTPNVLRPPPPSKETL